MGKKSRKILKICLKNEIKPDGRERSLWGMGVAVGMVVGWCGVGAVWRVVWWRGVWWLEGEFLWRKIYLKKRLEEVGGIVG